MITAFSSFSNVRNLVSQENAALQQEGANTTIGISIGPDFGFWVGLLATLAIVGVYVYFTYLKKPAVPVGAYQAPGQYAGPYQQPGQYPPTQYPPSQPYQQPGQYPGQPPQYPGQ